MRRWWCESCARCAWLDYLSAEWGKQPRGDGCCCCCEGGEGTWKRMMASGRGARKMNSAIRCDCKISIKRALESGSELKYTVAGNGG